MVRPFGTPSSLSNKTRDVLIDQKGFLVKDQQGQGRVGNKVTSKGDGPNINTPVWDKDHITKWGEYMMKYKGDDKAARAAYDADMSASLKNFVPASPDPTPAPSNMASVPSNEDVYLQAAASANLEKDPYGTANTSVVSSPNNSPAMSDATMYILGYIAIAGLVYFLVLR